MSETEVGEYQSMRKICWEFREGDPRVFSGAVGLEVKEGTRVGGFLQGAILEDSHTWSVGRVQVGNMYKSCERVVIRARREGDFCGHLVVNETLFPVTETGQQELQDGFLIFETNLQSSSLWNEENVFQLDLQVSGEAPRPGERLLIDWILILPNLAPTVPKGLPDSGHLSLYHHWIRPHCQTLYSVLKNNSGQTITFEKLWVNGQQESNQVWPVEEQAASHWFDIQPVVLSPGESCEVRVSLVEMIYNQGTRICVSGVTENQEKVSFSWVTEDKIPALQFTDISTSQDRLKVTFYVRDTELNGTAGNAIRKVRWDQEDVTEHCDLRAGKFFHGIACGVLQLSSPVENASYHWLEVEDSRGELTVWRVRILPGIFILGTYGMDAPEAFADYHAHGLNHYISFRPVTRAHLDALGALGMTGCSQTAESGLLKEGVFQTTDPEELKTRVQEISDSPGLLYYSLPDEPDVWDYHAGGPGKHARSMLRLQHHFAEFDPSHTTFVQLDNTFRTRNYSIYAPIVDCTGTHTYLLGKHFLREDRVCLNEVRRTTQPNPVLWVTQFYPLKDRQGERVGYNGRLPVPEEMHLQMLNALAGGAKGMLHYMHSGSKGGGGGAGRDKALWDAMTPMHLQLAKAGDALLSSTSLDCVESEHPLLQTHALQSGPETLFIIAINRDFSSTKAGFSLTPLPASSARVSLPEGVTIARIESVHYDRTEEISFALTENKARIQLPEIQTGLLLRITLHYEQDFP